MERKDLKLWARKEANNHRWQIWKCLLIILLVTLGLIVSLILIFNWLLSLKTTSIIGVLDFVIVLAILLAYLFSAGFSTQFYCYIKEIINNGNRVTVTLDPLHKKEFLVNEKTQKIIKNRAKSYVPKK